MSSSNSARLPVSAQAARKASAAVSRVAPRRALDCAIEPRGRFGHAVVLAPLRERLAAIAPERVERIDVVLLLAKLQRRKGGPQLGVALDAHGDGAQERRLAHAALADDELMLARAAARDVAQAVEQQLEKLFSRDEPGEKIVVARAAGIVERARGAKIYHFIHFAQ